MADLSKDVLAFSKEIARMCDAHTNGCEGCPADETRKCDIMDITPELIDVVQKWSDEHPPKTYAQDFREKFPNCAWRYDENRPGVCRNEVYHGEVRCTRFSKCTGCWNEPMPEDNNA